MKTMDARSEKDGWNAYLEKILRVRRQSRSPPMTAFYLLVSEGVRKSKPQPLLSCFSIALTPFVEKEGTLHVGYIILSHNL